jgi:D-lyxose ketol-isomerase
MFSFLVVMFLPEAKWKNGSHFYPIRTFAVGGIASSEMKQDRIFDRKYGYHLSLYGDRKISEIGFTLHVLVLLQ